MRPTTSCDLGRLADVAGVAARAAPGGLDLAGGLRGALGVEVDDRDRAALGGQHRGVGLAEASRAAGDERDRPRMPEVHRYRPLNSGSRLAKNAWMPSAASSVRSDLRNARTSMSIALSIGASSPSSTASMMSRVATGGRLASWRASALASSSVSPSLREPVDEAEGQALRARAPACPGSGTRAPWSGRSSRGRRCVPPKPGDDAEIRLGLSHPRRFLQQPEVTGHGDLAAAAEGVAVHGGDDRLGEPLDLAARRRCRSE